MSENSHLRWVITGTPRSGTTWIATVLDHAGLRTGHEHSLLYKDSEPDHIQYRNFNVPGESSYLAAPFVRQLRREGVAIVHLLRPPLDAINSMIGHGLALEQRNSFGDVVKRFTPRFLNESPNPNKYARYWLDWNALVDGAADMTWRLREVTEDHIEALAKFVGYPTFWAEPFRKISIPNVGRHPAGFTEDDFDPDIWAELVVAADHYGIPLTDKQHDQTGSHDRATCQLCPDEQKVRVQPAQG